MPANQTPRNSGNWPIEDGAFVYSTDGGKVGTIRNYDPQAAYLDVQKGWLFTKDFYVPLSAIEIVTGEGIILRQTKEQLDDERYAAQTAREDVTQVEDVDVAESASSNEEGSIVIPVLPTH